MLGLGCEGDTSVIAIVCVVWMYTGTGFKFLHEHDCQWHATRGFKDRNHDWSGSMVFGCICYWVLLMRLREKDMQR